MTYYRQVLKKLNIIQCKINIRFEHICNIHLSAVKPTNRKTEDPGDISMA